MTELKFYRCAHCGNIIEKIYDSGVPVICCGEPMKELVANTTDAAVEKHVPQVAVDGDVVRVQVGSVLHPMLPEHHITHVWLVTDSGVQRAALDVSKEPKAEFVLGGAKAVAVYEYCNLHGLWKKEL